MSKNKIIDPHEKVDDLFFKFIDELSELGKIATSELSHSSFISSDKESVDNYIKEYGDLLNKVNEKFNGLKSQVEKV